MVVTGALTQIRAKVRKVTGRLSSTYSNLSDAELDDYINSFYEYDLPAHLRLINLKQDYTLTLQPGIDQYVFTSNANVSLQMPAYVAGYEIQFYQDKETFFQLYPNILTYQTLATGTAIAGPYTGTITSLPIIRGTVFISTVDNAGNALSCADDSAGNLTGNIAAGATINYTTGAVAGLTWTGVIATGTIIYAQSRNYQASRPLAVLLYNDILTFRPIPDKGYPFVMTTYIKPTALLTAAAVPELIEWWELIAYGAAMKICADNMDMETYAKIDTLFDRQRTLVERRTLKQLSTQRANTIYSQYDTYPHSGQYPYL